MTDLVLDISVFENARNMMQQKFQKILGYYLEDTQSYLDTIKQGIEQKEVSMIVPAAHTIKSSSRQLGALMLSEIAARLEEAGRQFLKEEPNFDVILDLAKDAESSFVLTKQQIEKQT